MGLGFTYVFGPLQPDVTAELGIGRGEFAAAAQSRNFVVGLTGPLVGMLVVRFGSRPVLGASLVLLGSSAFLLSYIQDWTQLLGATLLLGLAISGVGDLTVGHAVSRWVRRSRGLALGILYTASNLGGMLLVPLVASVASDQSWREALRFAGGAALILLLPCAALVLPTPSTHGEDDDASSVTEHDMDLGRALRTRSFWVLMYIHLAYFAYAVAIVEHFVTFLMDAGVPRGKAAGFWSTAVGLGIASKLAFGFVSDRLSARAGMFILFGLISASSVMLLFAPTQPFLWLFVGLFGFSYAARDVLTPLVVIDCFGVRYMAKLYGALMPMLLVGGGAGSYPAGLCSDQLGSYMPAFMGLAAMNVVAVLLLLLLRRESARPTA
jgi:predicted MFS family arabinose efflux permease